MSKPPPKQNFLQTALLIMSIFLAINLFTRGQDQKDTRTLAQIFHEMQVDNQHLKDTTVQSDSSAYSKKLDELVNTKKMTPAQAEEKRVEAAILVADTQYKDGLYRNDSNRIRNAYITLLPFQKKLLDNPAWNKPYSVPTPIIPGPFIEGGYQDPSSVVRFPWNAWAGQALYSQVVKTLSDRNRTEAVWGFIPGYALMDFLVHMTGAHPGFSYAFAGFLLALLVRATVFPLSQKQLMYGRQMSQLGPLTNEIKQKYKNDQQTQQTKVMELYREYGINPLAGCFPVLIQMPLFFAVYQCMLRYQFTFQKGTFLWINPATSKATHGFIAPNLGQQDYILIIIYGITMVISTLLTPVTDPTQARSQRLMGVGVGVIFTFFMATGAFPVVSGFVLYWTFTNILATAQSLRAYRLPMPPLVKLNAQGGGVLPKPTSKWQQMMDRMLEEQKKAGGRNGAPPDSDKPEDKNGSSNSSVVRSSDPQKTGTPAKHKPKKRK